MNAYAIPGLENKQEKPWPTEYVKKALTVLGVSITDLRCKSKKHELVAARAAISKRMVKKCNGTLAAMGGAIGRDHATIIHYRDSIKPSDKIDSNISLLIRNQL